MFYCIWVFSPSISGLQRLLDICGDYAAEHEIAFNGHKTNAVFLPIKIINNLLHQMFFWTVYVCNFVTKWNTLVCWYMLHWRMIVIFRDKWNRYVVQQANSEALSISALLQ